MMLMLSDTARVLAAALELPREERTAVIDELMRSLDDAEDRAKGFLRRPSSIA
jgi:hypothetical protein